MSYKKIIERANDRLMAMAELTEDSYFNKIPKNKIDYFIDESIKIGMETAQKFVGKYNSLEEFCGDKKVKIELDTDEYGFEMIKLRGKYNEEKETIIMYHNSIKRMEIAYKELGIDFLNYDTIYKILLAHEVFHLIEVKEIGKTYEKLEDINIFKLGPLKKFYPIVKTSDIGANIFAKKFLNISYHPKVLNYLYIWGAGIIDKDKLIDYFDELDQKLNKSHLNSSLK